MRSLVILLTLSLVGILVICNVNALDFLFRVQIEGLLLRVDLFGKCPRCLDITIVLQELQDKLLDKLCLIEAGREGIGVGCLDFPVDGVSLALSIQY